MRVVTKAKTEGHGIRMMAFDWSGVISDDRLPVYESNMRILDAYKRPRITFEEWLVRTTQTPAEFIRDQGIIDSPSAIYKLHQTNYAAVGKEGINPVLYADAAKSLKALHEHGAPRVVISSHPAEHFRREAAEYGLKNCFHRFIGSVMNKTEGLLGASFTLGSDPSTIVYLGDMVYDIMAAKKAGVSAAAIATRYHT